MAHDKRRRIPDWLVIWFVRGVIAALFSLNRVEVHGEEVLSQARRGGKALFLGFWHGRMLYSLRFLRRYHPAVLVSPSRDGTRLAKLLAGWGYQIIPGSSNRRSKEALRRITPVFKDPEGMLVTAIDGPIGPVRKAKPGSLSLAVKTGALLVPISGSASRYWTFHRSWDDFQLPKPFGRIVLQIGSPLEIPPDADPREVADLMTKCTNELEEKTDALASNVE
ncbi:lysophospholipid acyltransferase family protein [Candidatus Neomarinimicrobiota bacterium]